MSAPRLPRPRWEEMRAADFDAPGRARWIAVLPVAAIEQHGPHLPLGVDAMIGTAMVERVIARLPDGLPASFLPVQAVGKSDEHLSFRGTLTLDWETTIRAWIGIGRSIARAGVTKLVLVTSHGGNVAPLAIIARSLRVELGMAVVATSWFSLDAGDDLFAPEEAAYGIHGGAAETSMMLAIRPELVRMDLARDFRTAQLDREADSSRLRLHGPTGMGWMAEDLHPEGAAGDATAATADAGEALMERQAAAFVDLLADLDRLPPPG